MPQDDVDAAGQLHRTAGHRAPQVQAGVDEAQRHVVGAIAGNHQALDPLQQRLFGGCHLTREFADVIADAGFAITAFEEFYEHGAPKIIGADSLGVAVAS